VTRHLTVIFEVRALTSSVIMQSSSNTPVPAANLPQDIITRMIRDIDYLYGYRHILAAATTEERGSKRCRPMNDEKGYTQSHITGLFEAEHLNLLIGALNGIAANRAFSQTAPAQTTS
jgi:hypothetical protein